MTRQGTVLVKPKEVFGSTEHFSEEGNAVTESAPLEPDPRYRLHGVQRALDTLELLAAAGLVPGHEWPGVIEAVGPGVTGLEPGQPVIERALGLARRGGRVVPAGLARNDVQARFPIDAVNNDLLISASFAYASASFAEITALLGAGEITAAPLITHRFPLEDYEQAYQVLRSASGPRGEVMLEVNGA